MKTMTCCHENHDEIGEPLGTFVMKTMTSLSYHSPTAFLAAFQQRLSGRAAAIQRAKSGRICGRAISEGNGA